LAVGIWWWLGAKNRYHGPVRTIDEAEFTTPDVPPSEASGSPAIAGGSE
jgi:hypothetical protein